MDKGRTEQIIEKLIDSIENGQSVPFGAGKVAVNKDETIMMLRELESIVNGELKIYREFNDRKGKIINDAKKEAEEIIYEAEQTASRIRVTKRMSTIGTAFKAESLDKEERKALRTAHDIYAASLIYTDEMLTEVNDVVAQAYDLVANQYGIMINTLQEKAELIAKNKAELMGSLKELSKEDRYTQILELGQLLSHELYNERMKARAMEEDGSYQMKMMFEEQVAATQQPVDTAFANVQPEVTADTAFVNVQSEATVDSAFTNAQPEAAVDSAFANAQPEVAVDSAYANVQPEMAVDSAFANVQPEVAVDSAFANVQPEAAVDSAFANVQPEAAVDSAFENVQPEMAVDSAFANVQPEMAVDSAFANVQSVAPTQGQMAQQVAPTQGQVAQTTAPTQATAQQAKYVPDEEHSIKAVSKTLEMFKNYRPGGNK
ncbi:MAG: hypothetical protein J6A59_01915 [Lachnospiraceae bacterium]|nr:hypothetical protein [Lachnospiraceae bacterium]